jgi:hypothetical protein
LWSSHDDVAGHCEFRDGTKRLLRITFESRFEIDIVDHFQITSGLEICFPRELQELIRPIVLNNPSSYFVVRVLDKDDGGDTCPGMGEPVPLEQANEADEFPEGREKYVTHRTRERNPQAVQRKKQAVLTERGALECEACGFNFERTYGESGAGFIECHHQVPVSSYAGEQGTRLSDLRLVCANCHRVLHRVRPWMSVDELRTRLTSASSRRRANRPANTDA